MTLNRWVIAVRAIRAIVRLELREMRRHRWRSLLVLVLVALPVAAVVGGTTLVRITAPTDEERRTRAMGSAALRIEAPFEYEERARIRALLPETATVQSLRRGVETVSVPGRRLRAEAIVLGPAPTADPAGLIDGTFLLQQGNIPRNAGEVALSPVLLEALDRSIGETVTLEFGAERTITGIAIDTESLDGALVVRQTAVVEHAGTAYMLVGLDGDGESVAAALRAAGFEVTERSEITGEGDESTWGLFILGSIGFLEAGLVVASTFIVGLRRRQYEIGLLGSTGATSGSIMGSLLVSTGSLAALGTVVGALFGTGAAAALFPFLDGWNRRLNGSFEIAGGIVMASLVLGVLVALLATALPARSAARLPIRVAMGGRRPVKSRSIVWLALGVGMVLLGLALVAFAPRDSAIGGAVIAITGSIMGVLGFGVSSPFLLDALGRCAGSLPLRWRLAVRDAGRFRGRNGPVVTAILAGMSMSVTVAVLVASLDAAIDALPSTHRTDQLLVAGPDAERVAATVVEELSGIAAARLEAVYVLGEPVRVRNEEPLDRAARQWVAVGDETLLRAIGAESGLEALRAGQLLRLHALSHDVETESRFEFTTWRDGGALDPLPVTKIAIDQNVMSPVYVLHRSRIEQLGWQSGPPIDRSMAPWLVRLDRTVTPAILDRAREIAGRATGVTVDAQLLRQRPVRGIYHVVQWLCILTGLVIVLVATALSSVESGADARVLYSVGAAPRLLRGHKAARAGYLAMLGCLLAVPAGLIPAIILFESSNLPLDIVVPWTDLAVALFALPLLAYGVTWITHRDGSATRRLRAHVVAATFACALLVGGTADAAPPAEIRWEPFVGQAFDGSPLSGELGHIVVPEKHGAAHGATIELAFVRYRTDHPDPGPPVFYLAGGPGGSGVEYAAMTATHPQMRFLEHADFIGLDQRGTGLSRPQLATPEELAIALPLDRSVSRVEAIAATKQAAGLTARYWQQRGIDPSAYNSRESADDIDAVRRALGLERIVIYGSSYGSHLGLAHIRRHPTSVARALLTKVEGPDDTFKYPRTVQTHLEALHRRCGGDRSMQESMPDLLGLIERLLKQLTNDPVVVVEPDAPAVTVGPYDLQVYLSNALSSAATIAEIPARLMEFSQGEFSALAATARSNREFRVDLMPWAMDCSSGATAARRAEIRRQTLQDDLVLGDAILAPFYPESCEPCPGCDLGDDFRSAIRVDVPVMFVSGTLDVRTPPANVEALAPGFPRHAHIRIERAGHEARELMSPEYRALFQAFLRGEEVPSSTITLPSVLFEPILANDP